MAQKIRLRLLADFKISFEETPRSTEVRWKVLTVASFFQKNGFVFIEKIWYFQASYQYPIVQKILFKLLEDFKTNL